jgi:hypothetical protein
MVRRPQTVNVDEEVLAEAQDLARATGLSLDDVVERALVLHVGSRALRHMQDSFDLDEDKALRVAYEELRAARATR